MAGSASVPRTSAPTCWENFKEWSLQNPGKISLAIAVIFTTGALVAHYAFSASLGWPVGIGVAGFVAVVIARCKLDTRYSKGHSIWCSIIFRHVYQNTPALVTKESVKYRGEGKSMLLQAMLNAVAWSSQFSANEEECWINLIKAIDLADPTLKDEKFLGPSTDLFELSSPREIAATSINPKIKNIFGPTNG